MTYGDFTDWNKRATAGKVLRDKAFNIAKNPKYDGYQSAFALMVYYLITFGGAIENEITSNKELAEELHKPILRKTEKRKVRSHFIDKIRAQV